MKCLLDIFIFLAKRKSNSWNISNCIFDVSDKLVHWLASLAVDAASRWQKKVRQKVQKVLRKEENSCESFWVEKKVESWLQYFIPFAVYRKIFLARKFKLSVIKPYTEIFFLYFVDYFRIFLMLFLIIFLARKFKLSIFKKYLVFLFFFFFILSIWGILDFFWHCF